MLSLRTVVRNRCLRACNPLQLKKFLSSSKDESGHSDSSDDEKEMPKSTKNQDALKRLNFLLHSMVKDEAKPQSSVSKLDSQLARPKVQSKKKEDVSNKDTTPPKTKTPGDALANATRDVAASLGGDVEQTESELLSKLRSHSIETAKTSAGQVAPSISLSELIVGMKIDRSPKRPVEADSGRAQEVRRILGSQQQMQRGRDRDFDVRHVRERRSRPEISASKVDIFGGEPLGIFHPPSDLKSVKEIPSFELRIWKMMSERELKLAITHPPSNFFEEMILWTEKGKLWNFPIDNEQGLEEESKVYFTEHVFLEPVLEPWCPRQGPIRHFMELVCAGLSKNPYITVQDKHDHILWFRDYFQKKQDILQQVGALGEAQKSIEAE